MRVFVTGASGWIGSAVVAELLTAGHEVVGLARSEESAERLNAAGALIVHGDLDEPIGLAKAADDADGVIHLAFQHEIAWSGNFAAAAAADRRAVIAMGEALAESDRPFVLASGVLGLSVGHVATWPQRMMGSSLVPLSARIQPVVALPRLFSRSLCEGSGCGRRYFATHRQSTAMVTADSWPHSSP